MTGSIGGLLREATLRLAHSPSARLDAELLLAHVLQKPRSFLFTWPEHQPDDGEKAVFELLLARREAGEPVAFLLGYREFFGHSFRVTPDTLIPRPDTELLVEAVLSRLSASDSLDVLDLGTGTGAIAVSVALERPDWRVLAADISPETLRVAEENARRLGARNARFVVSDWFESVPERFDAIVSNPPYIASADPHLDEGDVRFEPRAALVSGEDGLDDIRTLVSSASHFLRVNGLLALEHGYDQGEPVHALMRQHGYRKVETLHDMAGHPRVTMGEWPGE